MSGNWPHPAVFSPHEGHKAIGAPDHAGGGGAGKGMFTVQQQQQQQQDGHG